MQIARRTISVTEAAVCLGVSRNTAYQAVRQGTIPSIRVGRRVLVPVHALKALLSLETAASPTNCSSLDVSRGDLTEGALS